MQRFLLLVTYFVGMASLVLAGILGYEGYREARRLNAEIATLKVEIEQLRAADAELEPVAETNLNTSDADSDIATLKNRIAILEEAWRNQAPPTSTSTLPPLQGEGASDSATAPTGEECIPQGIGFIATAGQSFTICGVEPKVQVSGVGPSDILLGSGGTVPVGGQRAIDGTDCVVAGVSADATTGFAELRVTCG